MVTITMKATYSLDVDTARKLEDLAKRWRTSKSAALRRAIDAAAKQAEDSVNNEAIDALDRLQSLLALDQETAGLWADQVRQERRAALRNISLDAGVILPCCGSFVCCTSKC